MSPYFLVWVVMSGNEFQSRGVEWWAGRGDHREDGGRRAEGTGMRGNNG